MLFYVETNSKSGKIYLLATMKYAWCVYLSPPFTGINHYNLWGKRRLEMDKDASRTFKGKKNQRPKWYVLRCFPLNIRDLSEISRGGGVETEGGSQIF